METRSRRFSPEPRSTMVCDEDMERAMSNVHGWQRVPSGDSSGSRPVLTQHAVKPTRFISRDDVEWTLQATLDAHDFPPPVQQPDWEDAQLEPALSDATSSFASSHNRMSGISQAGSAWLVSPEPSMRTFTTETTVQASRPASGTLILKDLTTQKQATSGSVEPDPATPTAPGAKASVTSPDTQDSGGLAQAVAKYIFRTPGTPDTPASLKVTPPEIANSASWLKMKWNGSSPSAQLHRVESARDAAVGGVVVTQRKSLAPLPRDPLRRCNTEGALASPEQSSPVCGWGDGLVSPTSCGGNRGLGGLPMQRQGSLWFRRRTASFHDSAPLSPLHVKQEVEL